MLPLYLFALFGMSLLLTGGSDDEDETDLPETDPETGDFLVSSGQTVTGTDGADVFSLTEDTNPEDGPVSISAGAGDDTIDLQSFLAWSVDIDAGAGDDFVRVETWGATIDGGAGDDEIVALTGASNVYGGDGCDIIDGDSSNTDHSEFYGGAGNDVLFGGEMNNVGLFGGEGDDTLYTSGHAPSGNGYWTHAFGGEGDDILVHDAPPQIGGANVPTLYGGTGSDSFQISFSEAIETFTDDNGVVYTSFDAPPETSEVVVLDDFEVGVDQIQIKSYVIDDNYTVTDAELVEDSDAGITNLIVHYEAPIAQDGEDQLPDRDMIVVIHATGVTWDDVSFVGVPQPTVLQPTG